ncbi:hypothetical protein VN1226_11440 [Helicobacter pylori]|nr:hypothetical protein VN1226_11440 [Helicobacter pylori]
MLVIKNAKKDFASNPPKNKTQRLKSESSGDWQKERSNPQKKSLKKKDFKKRKTLKKERL